jgi:rod shape-determining protein MreD
MRNSAFVLVGILLLVVQSNLFRLLRLLQSLGDSLIQSMSGGALEFAVPVVRFLVSLAATPNLLLPLLVFTGVHEYSLVRGTALAFLLGYALDLFAAAPVGLFTVVSVATFVLARVAGVRLAAQTAPTQVALAFVFAAAQGILVFVLLAIFGRNPYGAKALAGILLPHAVATACAAPLVFWGAERVHRLTQALPGASSAGEGLR